MVEDDVQMKLHETISLIDNGCISLLGSYAH